MRRLLKRFSDTVLHNRAVAVGIPLTVGLLITTIGAFGSNYIVAKIDCFVGGVLLCQAMYLWAHHSVHATWNTIQREHFMVQMDEQISEMMQKHGFRRVDDRWLPDNDTKPDRTH